MKHALALTFATAALFSVACAAQSFADAQITSCRDVAASEGKAAQVQCELRSTDEIVVKSIKVSGDGKTTEAAYKPNNSAEPPVPVLILMDQGRSLSDNDFDRFQQTIKGIVDPSIKNATFGLYGFVRELKALAPLGTAASTISYVAQSDALSTQNDASELLKNVVEAIPILAKAPGDRKILIVFSNGRSTEKAYTAAEASEKLKQANITVIAVTPSNSSEAVTAAQSMRRLRDDTNGEFLSVQNPAAVRSAVQRIKAFLVFGGTFAFEPVAPEVKIEAELQSGKPVVATYKTALAGGAKAPSGGTDAALSEPKKINFLDPREVYEAFLGWLRASLYNQLMFGGAVLALAVVLILIGRIASRREDHRTEVDIGRMDVPPAIAPGDTRPILGWLEFLDGNQTREPVRSRATRIGRYSDNDVVLKNETVHRQHAIIKEDPAGGVVIVDLDTANGVVVNGSRIQKSARLQQGDLIELGEVRMRFSQPNAN